MTIPNTLRLPSVAEFGCVATSVDDVREAMRLAKQKSLPLLALGAGSNVVPQAEVAALVCLIRVQGIEAEEEREHVLLRVGAGENWHALVERCVRSGWYGLENLALIPGTVGAAPVQNIGAYGVELSAFVESVEVVDARGECSSLARDECGFSYRHSVFKARSDLVITAVNLRLDKRPNVRVEYPDLRRELGQRGIDNPSPLQVFDAVIAIRSGKLPDPAALPNAGSFFKNPVVGLEQARALTLAHPQLTFFEQAGQAKLSAAQLIDQAGWKERPAANVACWRRQPLVLINTDAASTADLLAFADAIRQDVSRRFGVQLELEPSLLS